MESFSLYLHIPFCTHRCGYCDFNTYARKEYLIPNYTEALCAEIKWIGQTTGGHLPVHTIFFGGGTPSLLPIGDLAKILSTLEGSFDIQPHPEISLEANPGTLSADYLKDLHSLGVNRLSLGVQSANPDELHILERLHDYPTAINSVAWARKAGFENINLDLIFGLPGQLLGAWQRSLKLALGLHPEHFSLYALSLEHDTPFGDWARRGILETPDADGAAEMYEWASEELERNRYVQYEISNWAMASSSEQISSSSSPELACRHNLQYWRNLQYLGFGAGAHGFAGNQRTANVLSPSRYIDRMLSHDQKPLAFPATPATQNIQLVDRRNEIGETMMMGLRLVREGISDNNFRKRFNNSLEDLFAVQIKRFLDLGLLEWNNLPYDRSLRLTNRGRLLGNQVFLEFI
jgi:oxygen-independent coproporphyrinogen-3 oxidase